MLSVDKKTGEIVVSPYSKFQHESKGLDVGTMIIQNYDFSWDDKTRDFIVVEGSKEDRQAYIDSFKDDCGVYNVLKKYALTGDASLLSQKEGFYGDISDIPEDELNPGVVHAKAEAALKALNEKLGADLTSDQLAKMSIDELNKLIDDAVAAKTAKEEVKEGE